jgi:hypothetical protein
MSWRHAFRTFFEDGTYQDILGQTPAGARRTAVAVRRMFRCKKAAATPMGETRDLGHRGTDVDRCPICQRKPALFPTEEPTRDEA